MAGHLRAVGADEAPPEMAAKSLVEASELSRRALLAKSRETIASTIDAGVPAHALARLINEMNEIDSQIRQLDAMEQQDSQRREGERRSFDRKAI